MPSTGAQSVVALGLAMEPVGKPDAGNPVFDGRGRETGQRATAPVLNSTGQGQKSNILVGKLGLLLHVLVTARRRTEMAAACPSWFDRYRETAEAPEPSYLGRITPRRIMGDTTWSEIWKSQSVGSLLALNSPSNPTI